MPSAPTNLNALKVEIAEDGTATLTGINYSDLRSLLTAASLERFNSQFKPKPLSGPEDEDTHASNVQNATWHLQIVAILDVLGVRMEQAISPQYAPSNERIASILRTRERSLLSLDAEMREAGHRAAAEKLASERSASSCDPLVEVRSRLREVLAQATAALHLVSDSARTA